MSEISGDIKGQLPKVLEAKAGGKNLRKWISTIKLPDISLGEMFRRYQRETILKDQVLLGLELLDVELTDLNKFNKLVSQLEKDFGLDVNEALLNERRRELRLKAAEKTLHRLETVTGWILLEGKFKIDDFSRDFYKLTYWHPVNDYIKGAGKQVYISTIVKKASVEPHVAGNYAQSIGRLIPIKVYGKVWQPLDRKSEAWEVQVTPLAIY